MKLKKSHLKKLIKEAAAEYVWGVKSPGRVANQYSVSELNLKGIICEEILNLLMEQPNVSPARHSPDVSPAGAGAGMIRANMADIEKIEDDTEEYADELMDITNQAAALGVDPLLVNDFNAIWSQLLPMMVDSAYAQYQMERPPPGA